MSAFSNGTECEAWKVAWCDSCTKDHDFQSNPDSVDGCPIILKLLVDGEAEEVHRGPPWSMQTVNYCTEYEQHIEPVTAPEDPPALATQPEDLRQLILIPLKEEPS